MFYDSQKNTCNGVLFLVLVRPASLLKIGLNSGCFPENFTELFGMLCKGVFRTLSNI